MRYRWANAAASLLLLAAAAVQLNDPDPVRWVLLYGVGAVFCAVAAVRDEVPIRPTLGWAGICLVAAAFDARWGTGDPNMGAGILRDEIVRETAGLSLMAGWMIALAGWTRARGRSADTER